MFAIIDNVIINHSPSWYRTASSQTVALGIVFFYTVSIDIIRLCNLLAVFYISSQCSLFAPQKQCRYVSSLHILLFNSMPEVPMDHL